MSLLVFEDYETMSRAAADRVQKRLEHVPKLNVIAATGDTPMGLYGELANRYRAGSLDTGRMRVFQLDAYLGIGRDDGRSLYRWMKTALTDPLDITPERVVRLNGEARDPEAECSAYDRAIEVAGGIDLAILGLGPNGHLGFNEPPCEPDAPTRVVELTAESVESNARYWGSRERVPRRALTAGMKQLLASREVMLLVSGTRKAEILRRTVEEPPRPEVPASWLQRIRCCTIFADREAASMLSTAV